MAKSTQTYPNHQWFKDRLSERKLSQRGLARSMDLDAAAVSLMLRGKRIMKMTEAAEIGKLLGRPASEVMEAAVVRVDSCTNTTIISSARGCNVAFSAS